MNRYNRIGESNAFLMVFSYASMAAALIRGGAGVRAIGAMLRGDLR